MRTEIIRSQRSPPRVHDAHRLGGSHSVSALPAPHSSPGMGSPSAPATRARTSSY
jgi:hypothetical protein